MDVDTCLDSSDSDAIRIRGTRVGLEHIVEGFLQGWTAEDIARTYPTLELKQVYAAICHYLHNQEKIDSYLARIRELDDAAYRQWLEAPCPPAVKRARELRRLGQQAPAPSR